MMDQQHWWKLLVSDKSGLMNTDDKASVLIQIVTIIAVTGVAALCWTDLISVLLNAVTDHAFFRVCLVCQIKTYTYNHHKGSQTVHKAKQKHQNDTWLMC